MSWNRLLAGRWLDAQVGSHLLIGAMVGSALWVAAEWFEDFRSSALGGLPGISTTLDTRHWIAARAGTVDTALILGFVIFFAICGLRRLVKKDIFAAVLAALLFTLSNGQNFNSPDWMIEAGLSTVIFSVLIFVLLRFGLVTIMATTFFLNSFNDLTLGTDWKTWYAPAGLAVFLLLLGISTFAFWRSLGSRELFAGSEERVMSSVPSRV